MKIENIRISDIIKGDNSRTIIRDTNLSSLMDSIRKEGLLQPIGVYTHPTEVNKYLIVYGNRRLEACYKLGNSRIGAVILDDETLLEGLSPEEKEKEINKSILIKNVTENINRVGVSMYELGRYYSKLIEDYDMTVSEVASRVAVPSFSVKEALGIFKRTPEKFINKIRKGNLDKSRKGNIPASIATKVINLAKKYSLSKNQLSELFETIAKREDIGNDDIRFMIDLLSLNYSFGDALRMVESKEVRVVRPSILIYDKDYQNIVKERGNHGLSSYIEDIIYNKEDHSLKHPLKELMRKKKKRNENEK